MLRSVINKIPFGTFTVIVIGMILYVTLFPDPFPTVREFYFEGMDKVVHFIMFFVLSSAAYFDVYRRKDQYVKPSLKVALYIVLFTILIGAITEIAQGVMGLGRTYSNMDLLADAIGAILGTILSNILFIRIYNWILRIR